MYLNRNFLEQTLLQPIYFCNLVVHHHLCFCQLISFQSPSIHLQRLQILVCSPTHLSDSHTLFLSIVLHEPCLGSVLVLCHPELFVLLRSSHPPLASQSSCRCCRVSTTTLFHLAHLPNAFLILLRTVLCHMLQKCVCVDHHIARRTTCGCMGCSSCIWHSTFYWSQAISRVGQYILIPNLNTSRSSLSLHSIQLCKFQRVLVIPTVRR